MAATLYGFKSCDTVKKARAWLTTNGVEHGYFDYRAETLPPGTLDAWFDSAGWEAVFNRASASFRGLPDATKAKLDRETARQLIMDDTNFIKRPVLDMDGRLYFGFRPALYEEALATR